MKQKLGCKITCCSRSVDHLKVVVTDAKRLNGNGVGRAVSEQGFGGSLPPTSRLMTSISF